MSRAGQFRLTVRRWLARGVIAWLTACTPISDLKHERELGTPDLPETADPSRPDAGETGAIRSGVSPQAIADPVQACRDAGARACASNETRTPLECDGTRWLRQPPCAEDEHCDATPGATQGRCAPIPTECVGRRSGEAYCAEADIRMCRAFVPSIVRSCAAAERCMRVNDKLECVCDFGAVQQAGRCVQATDCSKDQGGCDPLTTCSAIAAERVCGKCPDGFSGDGLRGCVPQLLSLELQGAQLSPAFSPEVTQYKVKLPLLRRQLTLKALAPSQARVEIDGKALPADGAWSSPGLPLGQHMLVLTVSSDSGLNLRYELMIERTGAELDNVRPRQPDAEDAFGYSLAMHGDTLVVGSVYEDSASMHDELNDATLNSGAAYVFVRTGDHWTQQAYLKSDAPTANDFFGLNVAVAKDTIAVSATRASPYGNLSSTRNGLVYVFQRVGSEWLQKAKLSAPEAAGADLFGFGLALQNDRLVVGAPQDSGAARQAGAAYVFTRTADAWSQPAKLTAAKPAADAYLGWSVALDGDTVVAGAHHDNQASAAAGTGTAHVFVLQNGRWIEQQELQAPEPAPGDMFGWSVGVLADTAVIGSPYGDAASSRICGSGRAYVFSRESEHWTLASNLEPAAPRDCDYFGTSVAISDGAIAVGADGDAPTLELRNAGTIYVYDRADAPSGDWTRSAMLKPPMPKRDAHYGKRLCYFADVLAVSAPVEDGYGVVHILR